MAFGWTPIEEEGHVVALKRNGASITLEPGGQFELSGAPLETIHETCAEVNGHLREVREVATVLVRASWGWASRPNGLWKRRR